MLEKIEILESFHDKEQSVILRDAMLCISLCLNLAITDNKELIKELENGG